MAIQCHVFEYICMNDWSIQIVILYLCLAYIHTTKDRMILRSPINSGSGYGSGYGYGDGTGDGYGYGCRYGEGYGSGDGYGSEYGVGSGSGYGDVTGPGAGTGKGTGLGHPEEHTIKWLVLELWAIEQFARVSVLANTLKSSIKEAVLGIRSVLERNRDNIRSTARKPGGKHD